MEEVAIPVVRPAASVAERGLEERLKRFLLEPASKAGVEVLPLGGVWQAPTQPAIYQTTDNGAWLFSDHEQDLAALELGGAIAAPREQIQRFQALAEAGISCDVVAIAHELPPDWAPGTRLVPAPPKTRQREILQAFAKQIGTASRATARAAAVAAEATAVAAGGLTVVALGTAAAAASAVPAVGGALLSLDPIVFGGVEEDGRVRWVELARWYW
jgi:hypothetical protein